MKKDYELYETKRMDSIRELISYRVNRNANDVAFSYSEKNNLIEVNYSKLQADMYSLGTWLFSNGFRGQKIALAGENSYIWLLAYFAIINGGNVVVPIDKELQCSEIVHLSGVSECAAIIHTEKLSEIEKIIEQSGMNIKCISFSKIEDCLEAGKKLIDNGENEYIDYKVDSGSLAAIVFTSGTTGVSKGVMLTQKNIMSDTYAACRNAMYSGNSMLVLPLHHMFGLVAGVLAVMQYGYAIYINQSIKRLMIDFKIAQPENMALVPLFVENMYKQISAEIKKQKKEKLISFLISLSRGLGKMGIDIRRKLFSSILNTFGGNLNVIICGGAALDSKYVEHFRDFGINILNGYGITECSPVVSVNRNKYYTDGSVGTCLCECEVRIDEPNEKGEGEICVKGNIVMSGYYNMAEETSEVLKDGWFYTGDIGYVDSSGFLFITGRKKNLIILSNGENVSPEELEMRILREIPLVEEIVVFCADGIIQAEIFPQIQNGIDENAIKEEINKSISLMNDRLPAVKRINGIHWRTVEFPKTTTKKIKRNSVLQK